MIFVDAGQSADKVSPIDFLRHVWHFEMETILVYLAIPHVQPSFDVLLGAVNEIIGAFSEEDFLAAARLVAERDHPGLVVNLANENGQTILTQYFEVVARPENQYRDLDPQKILEATVGDNLEILLPVTYSSFAELLFDSATLSVDRFLNHFEGKSPVDVLVHLLRLRPECLPVSPPAKSTTLDDRSVASNAGRVRLSDRRLAAIEPALVAQPRTFFSRLISSDSRFAHNWMRRIPEHLNHGDSRAAIVVQQSPFIVSAYSDEIDNVLLLRFDGNHDFLNAFQPGDRLLTVNTYNTGVARDCENGPAAFLRYGTFIPFIADILSEDEDRLSTRKAEIAPHEWARTEHCTERWLTARGTVARNGCPTLVCLPIPADEYAGSH